MPDFPDTLFVDGKKLILIKDDKTTISGENPKKYYQDGTGNIYVVKIEKERKITDVFANSLINLPLPDEPYSKDLQKHINSLRDTATVTSVIAGQIAKTIFPNLVVPENHLARLEDGTPVVLSKFLKPFDEFLSKTYAVTLFKPTKPTDWNRKLLRSDLRLNPTQIKVLGKIYYIALLMGHWDIVNNIDLKNSGSINIDGKIKPCIVDWGNCLGIGFGGLSQDATAFKNPQFKGLPLTSGDDSIMGFIGAVPFDRIVYPTLPRQVVSDLFDLTNEDVTSKEMFLGFKTAHRIAQKNLPHLCLKKILCSAFGERDNYHFKDALNKELFEPSFKNKETNLKKILMGRVKSIHEIIHKIDTGIKMQVIAEDQWQKITKSQQITKSRQIKAKL